MKNQTAIYTHGGVEYFLENVGPKARATNQWSIQSDINPNWWKNASPERTYGRWSCRHGCTNWPSKGKDGLDPSKGTRCDECGDGPFDPSFGVTQEEFDETGVKVAELVSSLESAHG